MPFLNPYAGCLPSLDNGVRVQTYLSKDAHSYIWSIRPRHGTNSTVLNLLWSKLIVALEKRGISDLTHQNDFERFVSTCVIVAPEETNSEMVKELKTLKEEVKSNRRMK